MAVIVSSIAALALAVCGAGTKMPPAPADPALREQQTQAFVQAMKPHHAGRPVVAIIALNEGTETTDFLLTHAVLQRAEVADVKAVASRRGRVETSRRKVLERHPGTSHVPHQRYLVDRGVATTTGITASIPVALALVQAIGGRDKAAAVAAELGASSWSPEHDSAPFALTVGRGASYLLNKLPIRSHERWGVDVRDGMDDIALALTADAWSRTGRVSVHAESASSDSVVLRSGMMLVAERPSRERPRLPLTTPMKPLRQLDATLCQIEERFGASRREWVVLEMEYSGAPAPVDAGGCRSS